MKRKSLCTGVFFAIFLLLMSHCAFAELTVYEEDFSDTEWDTGSIIVESGFIGGDIEAVEEDDVKALKVTASEDGTLGSGKLIGKAFVTDLNIADTSKVYFYTQKIKLTGTPDPTFNMSFSDGLFHDGYAFFVGAKDGKYVFASSGSSGGMASAKAMGEGWHTLVSKIFYNTTESKYDFVTTVYNEAGEKVWERLIRGTSIASAANPRKITYIFNGLNSSGATYISDAKLYVTSGKGGATVSNGETGVERNKDILIALSDGMDTSRVSLKDKDGLSFSGCEVIKTSPYTAKIAVKELLGKNAQYTVDFDDALGVDDIVFETKSQYVLDAQCSGVVDSDNGKKLTVNYFFNENSSIEKIGCRMMGIVYEEGKMTDAAMAEIAPSASNVNTELTAELIFNKNIGENAEISIVFFENGAYIPMSAGIALK